MVRLLLEMVTLGCAGIFAGGLFMVMCALVPSWLTMRPEQWVFYQQRVGPYIDMYMPIFDGIAALGAFLLMLLSWSSASWLFFGATGAFCGLIAVACISQFANVPMNREIRSWSGDVLPDGSLHLRERWIIWHFIRTVLGILAFIFLLLAVLVET